MAKDFGDTRATATPISINRIKPFSNTIGGNDPRDFLKVTLSARSSLDATLSRFKGNVRFALLDAGGNVLQTASPSGGKKLINTVLDAGDYVFRLVANRTDKTNYRLKVNAGPGNTDPTITTNTGVTLSRGSLTALSGNVLNTTDTQQSASELTYTLTDKPTAGLLTLDGNLLGVGSTFTQADIDAGRVSYASRNSVNQLTQNAFEDSAMGSFIAVGNDAIAWSGFDGTDYEVYLFDGKTTVPLTNNATDDQVTGISGKNIVWYGQGGSDGGTDNEIFFYDGATVRQLTTNAFEDINPEVSGSNVAWYGQESPDPLSAREIFLYDGTNTKKITTSSVEDFDLVLSGSSAVWYGRGGSDSGLDNEIFFYNGTSTQQLTVNSGDDIHPFVEGSNVAWAGQGGSDSGTDYEIFFYNGASTQQLTTDTFGDFFPYISGSNVVWEGAGGTDGGFDSEIFFYDGLSTRQLTTDTDQDTAPWLSGSNVTWNGNRGSDNGTDYEIYFYNGSTTQQLTQNSVDDFSPQVSGDLYAWAGRGGTDGGDDYEIFYGSSVSSDRFAFTVSDGAGGSTTGSFVFTIS